MLVDNKSQIRDALAILHEWPKQRTWVPLFGAFLDLKSTAEYVKPLENAILSAIGIL